MTEQADSPEEMVGRVRDAIDARDDMTLIDIREAEPRHVHVVVEQATSDSEPERILYSVERITGPNGEDTLRWDELGSAA